MATGQICKFQAEIVSAEVPQKGPSAGW